MRLLLYLFRHPHYNPGEFTIVDVLRERDVDAAFVMCADLVCHIPADCASYPAEIPLVCLDIAPCPTTAASDIVLPGVIDAMECDGTFYRLDDVAVHFELLRVRLSSLQKVMKIR